MANALNRNLKRGDKIVLLDGTVAFCGGECFGSMSFTSGTALDVSLEHAPGKPVRTDGFFINVEATMKRFAKENGWEAQPK